VQCSIGRKSLAERRTADKALALGGATAQIVGQGEINDAGAVD
jgi:hypothetical protein